MSKTLQEVFASTPEFYHMFSNRREMAEQFEDTSIETEHILFAWYDIDCWQGEAFVLFERDGQLYEVNGSHCSCYGLETQWTPEHTTLESLAFRFAPKNNEQIDRQSHWYHDSYIKPLCVFLGFGT